MKKFAVIGLGIFGTSLALSLASGGAEVIAIDEDAECVDNIKNDVAYAVKLDATNEKALKSIDIGKVDVVIIAIERDFEACQLATIFVKQAGVKWVISRAISNTHAKILELIGADEIVNPEQDFGLRLGDRLARPHVMDYVQLGEGYSMVEVHAPGKFIGKTLLELDLRKKYGVNLVGVKRMISSTDKEDEHEEMLTFANPENSIEEGDLMFLVGSDKDLEKITGLN